MQPRSDDEKKKRPVHPTPEVDPSKRGDPSRSPEEIPQELPAAEPPQPEIEPYQVPPGPGPDMPQPTA